MTSLADFAVAHDFDADADPARKINDTALDAVLADIAARLNALKAILDGFVRSDNTVGDGVLRLRSLHSEVTTILASAAGWQPKQNVLVATTVNITLSGEQSIDGVVTSGSRVLVKNQTLPAQNGIYVSAAGAWSRATDCDTAAELGYAFVYVSSGTTQSDTSWVQTVAASAITLGTTSLVWGQAAGRAAPAGIASDPLMMDVQRARMRLNPGGAANSFFEINPTAAGNVAANFYMYSEATGLGYFSMTRQSGINGASGISSTGTGTLSITSGGDILVSAQNVVLQANAILTLQTNGVSRWQVTAAGHLVAATDNAYDIGASGATRPRDVFIGRSLNVPTYTVAALPASGAGAVAYASNGRKNGEGAGLGTGCLVYRDATAWRRVSDDTTVAA